MQVIGTLKETEINSGVGDGSFRRAAVERLLEVAPMEAIRLAIEGKTRRAMAPTGSVSGRKKRMLLTEDLIAYASLAVGYHEPTFILVQNVRMYDALPSHVLVSVPHSIWSGVLLDIFRFLFFFFLFLLFQRVLICIEQTRRGIV